MAIHYNGDRFVGVAPPTENHGFLCSENEKRLGKRGRGREGGGEERTPPRDFGEWRCRHLRIFEPAGGGEGRLTEIS